MPTPGMPSGDVINLYNERVSSNTIKAIPRNPIRIMKFEILKEIEFSELEGLVRKVPLMKQNDGDEDILVYRDANISFRELNVEEVNPTTFYIVRDNLDFQRGLRAELMHQYGIDPLHLTKAYEIRNEAGEVWTLMPPVIEVAHRNVNYVPGAQELEYTDTFGIKIPIINDGAHRVYLAKEEGETFTGVYISGIPEEHPFYAHPNEWSRVKVVDSVPKTKEEKKLYSRDNCYQLYRDFGILGCGEPRGIGNG